MRKNLFVFLFLLFVKTSFCMAQYVYITIEGYQPSGKKYYFKVDRPKNLDVTKFQYMIWKTLDEEGYELTDSINADIVVKANYMELDKDAQTTEVVKIGEKKEVILGQEVTVNIMGTQKSDHYNETHYYLDLRACTKGSNENSLPIWHVFSHRNLSDISQQFIVAMRYLWFNSGEYEVVFGDDKGMAFKKVKINKKKLSDYDLSRLNDIVKDLNNLDKAEKYNMQINL